MLYLVSRPFLLKRTHFAKLDENPRSVSRIVRKVHIIGKIPFRDCKWVYCEHCGGKMSSPSGTLGVKQFPSRTMNNKQQTTIFSAKNK